jgi:hypothetical protein
MATITISEQALQLLRQFAEDRSLALDQAAELLISRHAANRVRIVKENGLSVLDIADRPPYTFEQLKAIEEESW